MDQEEKDSPKNYVPFQLCPKCNGDGSVMVQNWNGNTTSISTGPQLCNLCHGSMVIPMAEKQ